MLVRHSVKDQVYEIIKERILRGEYPPGSPVNISQLTSELGASNTPIREALSKLESEGLIVKKGSRHEVVTFTEKSNANLDQVMTIHILGAFDICVKDGRLAELAAQLRQAYEAQLEARAGEDLYDYLCKTIDFDRTVVTVAGNELLESMFEDMSLFMMLAISAKHGDRVDENLREHREILEAVESRDIELTRRLMRAHFDKPLSKYPA